MELETKGAVIFMKKKIIVLLTIAILSLCNTSVFAEESGYIWTQGESGFGIMWIQKVIVRQVGST